MAYLRPQGISEYRVRAPRVTTQVRRVCINSRIPYCVRTCVGEIDLYSLPGAFSALTYFRYLSPNASAHARSSPIADDQFPLLELTWVERIMRQCAHRLSEMYVATVTGFMCAWSARRTPRMGATWFFITAISTGLLMHKFQVAHARENEGSQLLCVDQISYGGVIIACALFSVAYTSGFSSVERMRAVLNQPNSYHSNTQAIIPSMNFTCNGSIKTWIFSADFKMSPPTPMPLTELQIWRSVDGGQSYRKVRSTKIMSGRNLSKIYYHDLDTPLDFQAGDIVGYYQSIDKQRMLFERVESGHQVYYINNQESAADTFTIAGIRSNTKIHALLSVVSGESV